MMTRSSHPRVLLITMLAIAGCRAGSPISGTPASDEEQAALASGNGVRREQTVPGQTDTDIIAATRALARDLAMLLRHGDDGQPIDIALLEFTNYTSLPEASFRSIRRRLERELLAAGPDHGLRLHADDSAIGGAFALTADVYDLKAHEGRTFLVDYELRKTSAPAAAADDSSVVWARRYWVSVP